MKVSFSLDAWREYNHWVADDPAMVRKINRLIEECVRHPFKGTGKPEPLKSKLKGYWSRRINQEHRLVYRVSGAEEAQELLVVQCRFHYEKQ